MKKQTILLSITLLSLFIVNLPTFGQEEESFTFEYKPLPKGETVTLTTRSKFKLTSEYTRDGEKIGQMKLDQEQDMKRKVTVLETGESGPSKVKVHYVKAHKKSTQEISKMGKKQAPVEQNRDKPVAGKKYTVERVDDSLKITTEEDKKITKSERSILEKNFEDLGGPTELENYLNGKTVTKGKTIDVPNHLARELFQAQNVGEVKMFTMTYKEQREINGIKCVVFDTSLKMTVGKDDDSNTVLDLSGETFIDSKRGIEMGGEMEGTITIQGTTSARGSSRIKVDGTGTGSFKYTKSYGGEAVK